jgi:methylene-tetrahydromethanopterin dehydrogenase
LVASVEKQLKVKHGKTLESCKTVVFGGTGPVGIASGIIASLAGSDTTLIDHLSQDTATDTANEYNRLCQSSLSGAVATSDQEKIELITDADIIFCTAKAGIQVLNESVLKSAKQLKVAGDINAVAPAGIAGIKAKDMGEPLVHATTSDNPVGVGPLAVGNIKYKLQSELLKSMLRKDRTEDKPVYLDFRDAFTVAREMLEAT